jgi:plastocyanin
MVGCGDDRSPVAERDLENGVVRVEALDNTFRSGSLQVKAGADVLFVNVGRNVHDIVPSSGSSEWGIEQSQFGPGGSYRVQFTEPGTYPYFCSIHGTDAAGMIGEIEVMP